MVFYFEVTTPPGCDPWVVYMGRDKHENEGLLAHGLPIDVWLHVEGLSSAHVYLRPPRSALPPPGPDVPAVPAQATVLDAIPAAVLGDACQLVKANSIAGSRAAAVDVCYTAHPNLLKRPGYDVGTVGFHDERAVRLVKGVKKDAEAVKRIERTRREVASPDLAGEKEAWEAEERGARKAAAAKARADEKAATKAAAAEKKARSYDLLHDPESMTTAGAMAAKYESAAAFEEDFM